MTAADVDQDGDMDMLSVDSREGSATVRLNKGDGTFVDGSQVTVGSGPGTIAAVDVDNDGDLDVLTSNWEEGTISVRMNNGQGVFSGTQQVAVKQKPNSITTGDVDGDGDMDMLIPNWGMACTADGCPVPTVSIRLNDGKGIFSGSQNVTVLKGPTEVVAADIDSDGDLDFVVSCQEAISIRFNDGKGNYSLGKDMLLDPSVGAPTTFANITSTDVDGDGDIDLILPDGEETVGIYLNNGQGEFTLDSRITIGLVAPLCVKTCDVDGDGDQDVLCSTQFDNYIHIRLNDGHGRFSGTQKEVVWKTVCSIANADLDGDGDMDLLTATFEKNIISVHYNNGTGAVLAAASAQQPAGVSLFPNPMQGALRVQGLASQATLIVRNAVGQQVYAAQANQKGEAILSLEAAPAGVYFVQAGNQVYRFLKE
ncbi:hypothetical protein PK28_17790 (plasmid) [Hymenobacter sp. DG25B]|uniref:T9SS type A sorting domain-containing protein n=1 Tax=Hymenobacter sp. DG25B TaxID=1385664 RepID=UPI000540DF36|nr:T9SS type A sorting domain-containing protein [Hymenobacter sp. DG25B]AIZ65488.1 hypothetical protein PK28_17790 [Hymenobacter sp. DG25B]